MKTFSADTMSEAMMLVREHFGENAIIVSTQTDEDGIGVRITAAIDQVEDEYEYEEDNHDEAYDDPIESIAEALLNNGSPFANIG